MAPGDEKKQWFHRVNSRLWLPISWEGWVVTVGVLLAIFGIVKVNGLAPRSSVPLSREWPAFLEVGVLLVVSWWITRGRVRR